MDMKPEEITDMESRILEAARQVFVRKGFEATTMSDVAAEAGIGRTALHYYYRTKQMLFDAILGKLMALLLPNIDRIMKGDGSMLEKMPLIIDQYVSVLRQNPSFPIFIINELNRDPEHLYAAILKDPARIQPLLLMRRQMEEEMDKGILRKQMLIDVLLTVISLLVFPLLIRHPLSTVFMEGDVEQYMTFYDQRKAFVKTIVLRMLTPDTVATNQEINS